MKIELTKEEKLALLQAVLNGILDTRRIERIYYEIKGNDEFIELMKSLPEPEEYNNDTEFRV